MRPGNQNLLSFRHLLGKKSWNVYNADNIAKVKRDEAAAAAREEAQEQRMQEVDAERRIQILRGLPVEAPSAPIEEEQVARSRENRPDRERKRRRIAGEDDTDRDIRFAQENNALVSVKTEMQMKSKKSSDAPITDAKGHINLFPVDGTRHNAPKNAEVEAEKAKKQKEFEDQYTMRFSNAAGFKQSVGEKPWYHKIGATGNGDAEKVEAPAKDVWGNEDPRRKEREKTRTIAADPLASIQKGVAGVREVERERKKWKEDKDREIRELEDAERRRERRKKRRREADLEDFNLDDGANNDDRGRRHRHHHHRSRDDASSVSHQRRSRSPDRSQHRSHHHRHKPVVIDNRTGWEAGPGGRYSSQFAHA